MIIEARHCLGIDVVSDHGRAIGKLDRLVINGQKLQVVGAQVVGNKLFKNFHGVFFNDIVQFERLGMLVKAVPPKTNLKELDLISARYGSLFGTKAVTESGQTLGKITDYYFDSETGIIVRLVVKKFLGERIIPRQFVVSVGPKTVVFQDVVIEPHFDQAVAQA
ncbi:PRC-barrel domain-containing protein [Candidatus Berkelbacteria bacterium]|nr:PRC-barrel domain-containing protein [Candidatus Berkelbacteria bacterium]